MLPPQRSPGRATGGVEVDKGETGGRVLEALFVGGVYGCCDVLFTLL